MDLWADSVECDFQVSVSSRSYILSYSFNIFPLTVTIPSFRLLSELYSLLYLLWLDFIFLILQVSVSSRSYILSYQLLLTMVLIR